MTTKGFPRLLVPRPPINAKAPAGVRGERPLGYVKTPADDVRSGAGTGKVTSHVHLSIPKASAPPIVRRYDKYGRETLIPEDVPFW
jgi:hypothetical protein